MRVDPTGHAWWHWALAAVVVVACVATTVVTCGGSLAGAATAIGMVASGGAAFSTASTVAAAATIGSATYLGMAAMSAAANSSSVSDFNDQGNWGTVAGTAGSAVLAGGSAYLSTRGSSQTSHAPSNPKTQNIAPNKYPGNDPSKCDVPGFEWRGSGNAGSGKGNFVNMGTGEWLHPDLNHGPPIGPHWDYGMRGDPQTFRIFPDNTILPK